MLLELVVRYSVTKRSVCGKISIIKMGILSILKRLEIFMEKIVENALQNEEMTKVVSISHLSKRYGKSPVLAADDINIVGYKNEVIGLLGRNGAGKSTTIKCLTGFLPFEQGEIKFLEYDIVKDAINAKKTFGYVPDDRSVFDKMTGMEYLDFMANVYKIPADAANARVEELQKHFMLGDRIHSIISSYSFGMKKKISIMGALMHNPKVLILDEPFTGLDPQTTYSLRNYIKEHAKNGNTVFFSSHNIDIVEKICDRVYIIHKGKLVDEVTVSSCREKYHMSLEEYFLEKCKAEEGDE